MKLSYIIHFCYIMSVVVASLFAVNIKTIMDFLVYVLIMIVWLIFEQWMFTVKQNKTGK